MSNAGHLRAAVAQVLEEWRKARRHLVRRQAARAAVHDWRVACRRLFALEELLAPRARRPQQATLQALLHPSFHAAGRLRDAQLAIRQLAALRGRFPDAERLRRHLHRGLARQRKAVTRAVQAIRPRAIRALVLPWEAWHEQHAQRLAAQVAQRLASAQRRLQRERSRPAGAEPLHRQRVHLKGVRYMREFCAAAGLPPSRSRRPPRQLASEQRQLGQVTDLQVLVRMIDRFARRHRGWKEDAAPLHQHLCARLARQVTGLAVTSHVAAIAAATTYGQRMQPGEE